MQTLTLDRILNLCKYNTFFHDTLTRVTYPRTARMGMDGSYELEIDDGHWTVVFLVSSQAKERKKEWILLFIEFQ
jgi:hypothetical protein